MFYLLMTLPFLTDFLVVSSYVKRNRYKRALRILLGSVYFVVACTYYEKYTLEVAREKIIESKQTVVKEVPKHMDGIFCTATYYNAVESQCDADPLTTASGARINLDSLNKYHYRWIAVSRDLLEFYKFGDSVFVESDNKSVEGWWIVNDLMNKRFTRRIDFLVPEKDTFRIGKCTVRLLLN